jgi:uncharacterized protein YkwD
VVAALEQSTDPMGSGVRHGRIDAAAALAALPNPPPPLPGPAQPASSKIRGSLSSGGSWRYRRSVGGGSLTATVAWSGPSRWTISARDRAGAELRQTGRSPLQLQAELAAGPLSITVAGKPARKPFTLTLLYPRGAAAAEAPAPPTEPTVLLSPLTQVLAGTPGPLLGAPPAGAVDVGALGFSLIDRADLTAPLLATINRVRRAHGLPAVVASRALARAALAHAHALASAGQFTHDWTDGTSFSTWILRYYPMPTAGTWSAGENLLWSTTSLTPKAAVSAWLASPGHRAILLAPNWHELGIGFVAGKETPGVYGGGDAFVVVADFGATGTHS